MFLSEKPQNLAAMLRSIADKLEEGKAHMQGIRTRSEINDPFLRANFDIDIYYVGEASSSDYAQDMAALDAKPEGKKSVDPAHKDENAGANILAMMGKTFRIPKFAKCVAVDCNGAVWAYGHDKSSLTPLECGVWVIKESAGEVVMTERIGDVGRIVGSWRDEIYPINQ